MSTVRIEAMNKCLAEISQGVSVKAIGLLILGATAGATIHGAVWPVTNQLRHRRLRCGPAMDLDERPCRCGRDDGFGRPPPSLPRLPAPCKKRPLQGLGYGRVNDVSKCVRPASLNSSVPVVK